MKLVAAFLLICVVASLTHADEYSLDTYSFQWTVAEVGNIELNAVKTDENSYLQLYKTGGMSSYLRLSASEAVEIGNTLADVNKYASKQKGSKEDVTDSVKAGGHSIYFRTSTKYGFSVTIRSESGFDSFVMEKSEANSLRPHLQNANEIIQYLEKRLESL